MYRGGIAFVIIGRNEGWKLNRCLASVKMVIQENTLTSFDVIYVDSDSKDESINTALSYADVAVIKLSGTCNAAIARNVGASFTSRSVIFFIDGDMEIRSSFLAEVYDESEGLTHDFVSGQVKNKNYDRDWNELSESWQYSTVLKSDKIMSTCGGVFLISHEMWDAVGGMDSRFKRGQDLDFSIRMSSQNKYLYRKKSIIADHHTMSYTHRDRVWKSLVSGDVFYAKSLLYRKHLLKSSMYNKMLHTDYSMLFLVFCVIWALTMRSFIPLTLYFGLVAVRVSKKRLHGTCEVLSNLAFFPVRDIAVVLGILFFHPPKPTKDDYAVNIISSLERHIEG